MNEIKVKVASHGANRNSRNLMMYYYDPVTEKRVTRSTGTTDRREADRKAAVWEDELNSGRYFSPGKITWEEFRQRYEDEKLSSLADGTWDTASASLNVLERIINPKRLASVNADALSRFQSELRKQETKDTTIARHLRQIKAALNWGVSLGMLAKCPKMEMPKRAKGDKHMRGRPITAEEYERMLDKVPKVRPKDPTQWKRYLTGLWLSGLRLAESMAFSWDPDASFAVDLSGDYPLFRIHAEAEKGHQNRLLPMVPDFAEWLLETPEAERWGRVFKLTSLRNGRPIIKSRTVGEVLSRIGEKAGVVVDKQTGKFASAHDLRRGFGTRWARKVKPATLQLLMRHEDIQTTMKYYVGLDANEVAAELWSEHRNSSAPTHPPTRPQTVAKNDQRVPR